MHRRIKDMSENTTFQEILSDHFEHPWLKALNTEWPISFAREEEKKTVSNNAWHCIDITQGKKNTRINEYYIRLQEPDTGIEAKLRIEINRSTRVVKLGGQIFHNGSLQIKHFRDPKILSLSLLEEIIPTPIIRRITGGPWGDVAYPPVGFQVQDVQIVPHLQQWKPVEASCPVEDGRCSQYYQPIMMIADHACGLLAALEWAGAYSITCQRDQDFWGHHTNGDLLINAGVSGIDVTLQPGMTIPLPNVYLVFYEGTLEDGAQVWRRHVRDELAPRLNDKPVLPFVSYNHWIAYEIEEFNEKLAIRTAKACAEAGIEYMCFDAGWYTDGFRDGNGNWELPDARKIPSGFEQLGRAVSEAGVKFGCWLEPEFAAINSKLYREHPDWFITLPDNKMALMNFALPEVRDWWVKFFEDWYQRCHVRWVRWDFNQPPGIFWSHHDTPTTKGLTQINHIRGLYAALDRILKACPDMVIEQCAGGGTRIEPGIIARSHTYWIDDHSSSPHLVRFFQHGMNRFWPAHYANVNVVSRDGKLTESEWLSHQAGSFGISSRLIDWDASQMEVLSHQIKRFKGFRPVLEKDFHSVTGQPTLLSDSHELEFGNSKQRLLIHHDLDSGEGYCRIKLDY